ncbi:MAG: glycosyltransferase family 4 protein [Actinobacteria bacterium]|nr:glycosyltransferase family 4 protein [Actinomycetota bacterium]
MRIAMVAPVWIPIPPDGYGGIERVLKLLVDELVDRGEEVTLFAAGDCRTRARQRIVLEHAPTQHMGETLFDALHVGQAYREISAGGFDIVHDHSGFLGPAFAGLLPLPVVHTLHGPFTRDTRLFYENFKNDCWYVAISRKQMDGCPGLNYLGVVPNGVDVEEYRLQGEKDDYLVCVSRICEAKGTENAVRLALKTGHRILLAGKIDPGADREYFETRVKPLLDGERAVYLGEVSQEEKVRLVSRARAFIFPIQWEEPFGLVMAEALACGTPVLATRWGAVPEVVEHGVTGFLADTPEELEPYLERIDEIDPAACRRAAEERFSPRAMADSYLEIYRKALEAEALMGSDLRSSIMT